MFVATFLQVLYAASMKYHKRTTSIRQLIVIRSEGVSRVQHDGRRPNWEW